VTLSAGRRSISNGWCAYRLVEPALGSGRKGYFGRAAKKTAVGGDFSRLTFTADKHYSAVLQQQGRVQLDADWNEEVEICAHRERAITGDMVGPCGAPELDGGFAISCTEDGDLRLSAGRLYVAGMLCELEAECSYTGQPDLPRVAAISPAEGRTDLVYLDLWERLITAVEDPEIREPALGGPDTATRMKTVWQVKILPDVAVSRCEEQIEGWPPPASDARLAATIGGGGGIPGQDDQPSPSDGGGFLENALYRFEIHESGPMGEATFKWSRENGSLVLAVRQLLPASDSGRSGALVERIGREPQLALKAGDWMEALGDESEVMLAPGAMMRVERVDEAQQVVWLDGDLSLHASEPHLKLRRWEAGGALPVTAGVNKLDQGIEVQFSGASFATGDYWMFPVRQAQPPVEWSAAPPNGIQHHYCRLALVTWRRDGDAGWTCEVTDCRPLFRPLTRVQPGACGCKTQIDELCARLEGQARELRELRARLA
jgi:hypothetical protein